MVLFRCPQCQNPLSPSATEAGICDACRAKIPAEIQAKDAECRDHPPGEHLPPAPQSPPKTD